MNLILWLKLVILGLALTSCKPKAASNAFDSASIDQKNKNITLKSGIFSPEFDPLTIKRSGDPRDTQYLLDSAARLPAFKNHVNFKNFDRDRYFVSHNEQGNTLVTRSTSNPLPVFTLDKGSVFGWNTFSLNLHSIQKKLTTEFYYKYHDKNETLDMSRLFIRRYPLGSDFHPSPVLVPFLNHLVSETNGALTYRVGKFIYSAQNDFPIYKFFRFGTQDVWIMGGTFQDVDTGPGTVFWKVGSNFYSAQRSVSENITKWRYNTNDRDSLDRVGFVRKSEVGRLPPEALNILQKYESNPSLRNKLRDLTLKGHDWINDDPTVIRMDVYFNGSKNTNSSKKTFSLTKKKKSLLAEFDRQMANIGNKLNLNATDQIKFQKLQFADVELTGILLPNDKGIGIQLGEPLTIAGERAYVYLDRNKKVVRYVRSNGNKIPTHSDLEAKYFFNVVLGTLERQKYRGDPSVINSRIQRKANKTRELVQSYLERSESLRAGGSVEEMAARLVGGMAIRASIAEFSNEGYLSKYVPEEYHSLLRTTGSRLSTAIDSGATKAELIEVIKQGMFEVIKKVVHKFIDQYIEKIKSKTPERFHSGLDNAASNLKKQDNLNDIPSLLRSLPGEFAADIKDHYVDKYLVQLKKILPQGLHGALDEIASTLQNINSLDDIRNFNPFSVTSIVVKGIAYIVKQKIPENQHNVVDTFVANFKNAENLSQTKSNLNDSSKAAAQQLKKNLLEKFSIQLKEKLDPRFHPLIDQAIVMMSEINTLDDLRNFNPWRVSSIISGTLAQMIKYKIPSEYHPAIDEITAELKQTTSAQETGENIKDASLAGAFNAKNIILDKFVKKIKLKIPEKYHSIIDNSALIVSSINSMNQLKNFNPFRLTHVLSDFLGSALKRKISKENHPDIDLAIVEFKKTQSLTQTTNLAKQFVAEEAQQLKNKLLEKLHQRLKTSLDSKFHGVIDGVFVIARDINSLNDLQNITSKKIIPIVVDIFVEKLKKATSSNAALTKVISENIDTQELVNRIETAVLGVVKTLENTLYPDQVMTMKSEVIKEILNILSNQLPPEADPLLRQVAAELDKISSLAELKTFDAWQYFGVAKDLTLSIAEQALLAKLPPGYHSSIKGVAEDLKNAKSIGEAIDLTTATLIDTAPDIAYHSTADYVHSLTAKMNEKLPDSVRVVIEKITNLIEASIRKGEIKQIPGILGEAIRTAPQEIANNLINEGYDKIVADVKPYVPSVLQEAFKSAMSAVKADLKAGRYEQAFYTFQTHLNRAPVEALNSYLGDKADRDDDDPLKQFYGETGAKVLDASRKGVNEAWGTLVDTFLNGVSKPGSEAWKSALKESPEQLFKTAESYTNAAYAKLSARELEISLDQEIEIQSKVQWAYFILYKKDELKTLVEIIKEDIDPTFNEEEYYSLAKDYLTDGGY